ncbi:MAG: hypothetical protein R3E12_10735 [Candidatus Eisenbacteria bacterium]
MEEVAVVRAEPVEGARTVGIGEEQREAVHRPEVVPARVDDLAVGKERRIEVIALVEADPLEVGAVRIAGVEVLGRRVIVFVHVPGTAAGEHDPAVGKIERIEVVAAARRDLPQVLPVGIDLIDVVGVRPDLRSEKRIFLPSNETHGSSTVAPTKSVIGVTLPSGEIGSSLKRLLSPRVRLSVSSKFALTKTRASVVSWETIRSSGALSRHAERVTRQPVTPRTGAMMRFQRCMPTPPVLPRFPLLENIGESADPPHRRFSRPYVGAAFSGCVSVWCEPIPAVPGPISSKCCDRTRGRR